MEYFGYYEDKDAYDGREEIRENAQRKGFTLVEVMVCIGILGTVLAIVAPPIVRLFLRTRSPTTPTARAATQRRPTDLLPRLHRTAGFVPLPSVCAGLF